MPKTVIIPEAMEDRNHSESNGRPSSFWKQWKITIVVEDNHYVMHRTSMLEYFGIY